MAARFECQNLFMASIYVFLTVALGVVCLLQNPSQAQTNQTSHLPFWVDKLDALSSGGDEGKVVMER